MLVVVEGVEGRHVRVNGGDGRGGGFVVVGKCAWRKAGGGGGLG